MKMSVIREFVCLARSRNFTRTAQEMYIAQSALSRHISALEDELGAKLIERDHSHFELTPAGEATLETFRRILKEYDGLLDTLAEQDKLLEGEIHLGFLYYDRDCYVSQIRKVFRERYPGIRLVLHSGQPHELEEGLFSGAYDAVIEYGASSCGLPGVTAVPFLRIPYCLIYRNDHRFALMDKITASDLSQEQVLVPSRELHLTGVGRTLPAILDGCGVRFSGTVPIDNYDEVPGLMEETGAVYLSPMANQQAYGPETSCREFLPDTHSCDVDLVWLEANDNPALPRLAQVVRSCYP